MFASLCLLISVFIRGFFYIYLSIDFLVDLLVYERAHLVFFIYYPIRCMEASSLSLLFLVNFFSPGPPSHAHITMHSIVAFFSTVVNLALTVSTISIFAFSIFQWSFYII